MKVHVTFVYAMLVLLLTFQIALYNRVGTLDSRHTALARNFSSGSSQHWSVDQRVASLKRTVEKLTTRQRKIENETAATLSDRRSQRPAGEGEKNPAGELRKNQEEVVEEESEEDELEELAYSLEMRSAHLEEIRASLLELDANADSRVTLEEFEGEVADFFYFDKNGNGHLTPGEIERVVKVEQDAIDRVLAADQDGDEQISPGEFGGSPRKFRFYDQDQDGGVTADEYVAGSRRVRDRLRRDDIDGDRKLSLDEFTGGLAKYKKYDEDDDGFIGRSELKDMLIDGYD